MPRAQSADGVMHDFPDGTDQGVIDKVMKDYAAKSGIKSDTPAPATTPSGLAASAARGAAPYAAGAGVGAAIGAPFGGVGAIPGAIAGMGAVGATELGGTLYNALASRAKLPEMLTPQGATDKLLDVFGIKRPSTEAERLAETVGGVAPLGVGSAKGIADIGTMVSENRADAAEKYIDNLYTRSIKPSTVGRDSALQRRSAISDIVEQKPSLKYTDAEGKVLSEGHLPKTPVQFGEAIDQAKDSLFNQWDALAKTTEGAGVKINTKPIVARLLEKARDPVLLRDDPGAAAYAEELAGRYAKDGALLPSEVQRSIAGWNQKLKAFYRNPVEEGAGRNGINEALVGELRTELDRSIAETAAPGYQSLKNRYGALRAIENDVDRATRRISNREPGGGLFGRASNLVAGEEVIRGAMTGNMKAVATGVGVKGLGELVKYLNSPNRAITKMFETAEKYHKAPMDIGGVNPLERPPAVPPLALPAPTVTGPAHGWTSTGSGMIPPSSPAFTMTDPVARALRGY